MNMNNNDSRAAGCQLHLEVDAVAGLMATDCLGLGRDLLQEHSSTSLLLNDTCILIFCYYIAILLTYVTILFY